MIKRAFERRGDDLVDRTSECRGLVVVPVRLLSGYSGSPNRCVPTSRDDLDGIASGDPKQITVAAATADAQDLREAVATGLSHATLTNSVVYVSTLAKVGGARAIPALNEHLKRILAIDGERDAADSSELPRATRSTCRAILSLNPDHGTAARLLCGMLETEEAGRWLVVRDLVRVFRPGMRTEAMDLVRRSLMTTSGADESCFVLALPVLARLDPLVARQKAAQLLEHGSPQCRYELMQQLMRCDLIMSDLIARHLEVEQSIEVRLLALRSAPGCVLDPPGILREALSHESPAVRWEARTALRTYHELFGEDELALLLQDEPDELLREYGVEPSRGLTPTSGGNSS